MAGSKTITVRLDSARTAALESHAEDRQLTPGVLAKVLLEGALDSIAAPSDLAANDAALLADLVAERLFSKLAAAPDFHGPLIPFLNELVTQATRHGNRLDSLLRDLKALCTLLERPDEGGGPDDKPGDDPPPSGSGSLIFDK